MKNKKAAFDIKDLPWLAITFGIGVITLAITASIVGDIKTSYSKPSQTQINESDAVNLLWGNNTNMTLDHNEASVLSVYNCSGGTTIDSGSYTVYFDTGKIQCDTNSTVSQDSTPMCVNYSYLVDDEPYNITVSGGKGQLNFSNWFTTIGLVLGAVVVLTTLGYLGFIRKG